MVMMIGSIMKFATLQPLSGVAVIYFILHYFCVWLYYLSVRMMVEANIIDCTNSCPSNKNYHILHRNYFTNNTTIALMIGI